MKVELPHFRGLYYAISIMIAFAVSPDGIGLLILFLI